MTDGCRIAYLLPDPGIPVGGTKGASIHVDALCGAMARQGASVTLYAAKVIGPLSSRGSDLVDVVPVDVGPVRSGRDADTTRMRAAHRFFEIVGDGLDRNRPDWVHERLSLFAGEGTRTAAERGLPRIVEVNAPVADERLAHFGLDLVAEAKAAERDALLGARVLAVSGPLATWAMEQGASGAVVVPNGADTTALAPGRWAGGRASLRRELGFDLGTTVIGFAGSLKPWHGVELLVEAIATADSSCDLGLLVVGDGPQREAVEERVRSVPSSIQVALTGAVPATEVPSYLAAMDVAVAPYLPSDAFYFSPLKVAEAMAAGLPVVASDFPPVRELLGSTGVLVRPGDIGALSGAIGRVAGDPIGRAELALAGRSRAVARLDWSAVARTTMYVALGVAGPQLVEP